jgi:hypothetical protein
MRVIADKYYVQLPFLCQLSKSAPKVLWTVRGFLGDNPLQVARSNPAVWPSVPLQPCEHLLSAAFCRASC